jgi:hypothetical protein
MGKTFLYRFFKLGAVPADAVPHIQREGVLLQDEGIGGSVTYRKYRSAGRYHGWSRKWFSGSIVMTREHFLAFRFSKQVIGVSWKHEKLAALRCALEGDNGLCVNFEASDFADDCSGEVNVRFTTHLAREFLQIIEQHTR